MGRSRSQNGECRSTFKMLTGKPTGRNTSLGKTRRRLEDNIKIYLKEIGFSMKNWIDSVQHRNYCKCGLVHQFL